MSQSALQINRQISRNIVFMDPTEVALCKPPYNDDTEKVRNR